MSYDEKYIKELEGKIIKLETDLANVSGVLYAVERAVRKGNANYDIEDAYEEYEAKLKEKNT